MDNQIKLPSFAIQYLEYLLLERGLAPSTVRQYRHDIRRFLLWYAKTINKNLIETLSVPDLARCDRKRIRRWLVALSEKELSEATKARQMASVGGMFQYLVYEGLLNKNPMDGVPRPAQDKSRRLVIYLTEEQVEHLLDEIPGGRGLSKREMSYNAKLWPRDRALIVTMLYQGLRISEAASLTLGDLDFEDQTLRVIGKGNKERLLPLHPRTVKTIRFYLDFWPKRFTPTKKEDRLWRSRNGSPLTVDGARKAVSRQLRRVLGDRYTPHKLRHTFGTRLANLNVDMLVIRDLMGHASISTTQVYTHVQKSRLKSAIEML